MQHMNGALKKKKKKSLKFSQAKSTFVVKKVKYYGILGSMS